MNSQDPQPEFSIKELDDLVTKYAILRQRYEDKKKLADEASQEADKAEAELLDKLKSCGKSKYILDGVGTVSCVSRLSYRTPKDPEKKKELFRYIEEAYGPEVLMGLIGINSQSLNSFFKEAVQTPPGLEAPVANEYVSLRRK